MYCVEGQFGAHAELFVAVYLQRRKVVEVGRGFGAVLFLYVGHGERLSCYGGQKLLAFFFHRELALGCAEHRLPVGGRQYPIRLGLEVLYLFLSVDYERESGGLNPSDAQHLAVLAILERVEACCIHAENPVADGSAQPGEVEWLVVGLVFERPEALGYGLICHG